MKVRQMEAVSPRPKGYKASPKRTSTPSVVLPDPSTPMPVAGDASTMSEFKGKTMVPSQPAKLSRKRKKVM